MRDRQTSAGSMDPQVGISQRGRQVVAILSAIILIGLIEFWREWGVISQPVLGSDWLWYRDGIERLASGRPLYDPAMLNGPFFYLAPDLEYHYNQTPWLIPIVWIFAALPEPVAGPAWLLMVDLALCLGLALVWPRRLTRPAQAGLALLIFITPAFLIGMEWGNVQGLVVLGIGCFWYGWRRGSGPLMALGLALASLKVVPALALLGMLPLLPPRRAIRVAVLAGLLVSLASVPVLVLAGPTSFLDFVRVQMNIEPVGAPSVAPALILGMFVPWSQAFMVSRVIGLGFLAAIVLLSHNHARRFALLLLASCLLVTNLYSDWLLGPILGLLAVIGARSGGELPGSPAVQGHPPALLDYPAEPVHQGEE